MCSCAFELCAICHNFWSTFVSGATFSAQQIPEMKEEVTSCWIDLLHTFLKKALACHPYTFQFYHCQFWLSVITIVRRILSIHSKKSLVNQKKRENEGTKNIPKTFFLLSINKFFVREQLSSGQFRPRTIGSKELKMLHHFQ